MKTKNIIKTIKQNGYCVLDIKPYAHPDLFPLGAVHSCFVLCHSGELVITSSGRHIELHAGVRAILPKITLFDIEHVTPDFSATVLMVSENAIMEALNGITVQAISKLFTIQTQLSVNGPEWKMLTALINNFKLYRPSGDKVRRELFVNSMVRAIIFTVLEMESDDAEHALHDDPKSQYSQADQRFLTLVGLLKENVKEHHDVIFYAKKLDISSKYLSDIIEKKCGMKAKELISRFLVSQIKQDIMLSGKSVKALAYEYCFADQSSFGKFFRKMTGQSPSEFKRGSRIE